MTFFGILGKIFQRSYSVINSYLPKIKLQHIVFLHTLRGGFTSRGKPNDSSTPALPPGGAGTSGRC
jgi:hypothetical protein